MGRTGPGEPEVFRITGAQAPHSDDLERRIGRYLVSMLVRTVCVVLVLVVPGPARWVFAVGAVILPYIAVVLANTGQPRREAPPPTIARPSVPRPAVGSVPRSEPGHGDDPRPVE